MLLCKGILVFLLYLITYYAYGLGLLRLFRVKQANGIYTLVSGFFFYALCFMVFALIAKSHRLPLSDISIVWAFLWAGSVFLFLFFFRKEAKRQWQRALLFFHHHRISSLLFLLFCAAQLLFNGLYGRWSSSNNQATYVGYVTTAVFTNELGTTHPVTGLPLTRFDAKLFTQTMLDHSAVVSKIFRMHPLIETRWVVPFIFLFVGSLMIFLIARTFFREQAKQWLFFAMYQAIVMLTANSFLMGSYYIYFRNYEGKNVMTALVIPVLFYVFWKLYQNPKDQESLGFGVLAVAGSYAFTGSALYMVPVMCLGLIPILFSRKHWKQVILDAVLLSLPCILYAVYYLVVIKSYPMLLTIR